MRIYAMADLHGCIDAFKNALSLVGLDDKNNMLILCGDYIHVAMIVMALWKRLWK